MNTTIRRLLVPAIAAVLVAPLGALTCASAAGADAPSSTVVGWGDNLYGQALPPAGLTGVSSVAAGGFHTLAVHDDGTVTAWGYDKFGETDVPADLPAVTQVAAGDRHSLALTADGHVVAWGDDVDGQTDVPAGLSDVTQVAAGGFHSLALTADGTVVAWGDDSKQESDVPPGLTDVIAVAAGEYHSLALKADGKVVAWGDDRDGQIDVPAHLSGVTQVAAGGFHSLALTADGTVVAWGDDTYGQTDVPADLSGVTQVAAGGFHSLALTADGTVVSWSDDSYGGTALPAGLNGVVQIAAGRRHSVALVVDRSVVGFRRAKISSAENAGTARLVITRTGNLDTQADLQYAVTGGTATAGEDYALAAGPVTFAAEQTTAVIELRLLDDAIPEPDETVTVTLRDPGPGTSVGSLASATLTIEASDQRPDALVSPAPSTGYLGDNVYNGTAAGQTVTKSAPRGTTRRVYVRLYDDTNATNTFTLHSGAPSPGSSVRFRDSELGFDVTSDLRSAAGWAVRLTPRHYVQLAVRITVSATARIGTVKSATVTGTWLGDQTSSDTVRAQVRVIRRSG